MLLLLRMPRTRLVYVTSQPVSESIIDYYLHLLPGVPHQHARERLTLLSCQDASNTTLTKKILDRPRLLSRIADALGDRRFAHMTCFNVSPLERRLAAVLGIPIYGCDPRTGAPRLEKRQPQIVPRGRPRHARRFEDLADEQDVAEALSNLKARNPDLERAVVKLNDGFSGEGNAVFSYAGLQDGVPTPEQIRGRLPDLQFVAKDMNWDLFHAKTREMGSIVEAYIEGEEKRVPSVQCRIDPVGNLSAISTHDQLLGGGDGQVFWGAVFPPTTPTGWTSRKSVWKLPACFAITAFWAGLELTSFPCAKVTVGATTLPRSICERAARPIRLSCCNS